MDRTKRYILYIFFAVVSTLVNIATQMAVEYVLLKTNINALNYQVTSGIKVIILIKMSIATVVAFIFKFIVDKVVIFQDKESGVKENFRKITVYGFFAIFTTLIFWGFELFFKFCFAFRGSEYFGAVIGLATGYTIKFFLDSKFVFQK